MNRVTICLCMFLLVLPISFAIKTEYVTDSKILFYSNTTGGIFHYSIDNRQNWYDLNMNYSWKTNNSYVTMEFPSMTRMHYYITNEERIPEEGYYNITWKEIPNKVAERGSQVVSFVFIIFLLIILFKGIRKVV